MCRLYEFLSLVRLGEPVLILDRRFRLEGAEEVLWTNQFDDLESVPEDLLRRKVVRVGAYQNGLKIWVK